MNEWICADDRLPEAGGTDREGAVLCWVPPREGCRQSGLYLGKICKVEANDGSGNFFGIKTEESDWTLWGWSYFEHPIVTHWMPLPEVPR